MIFTCSDWSSSSSEDGDVSVFPDWHDDWRVFPLGSEKGKALLASTSGHTYTIQVNLSLN